MVYMLAMCLATAMTEWPPLISRHTPVSVVPEHSICWISTTCPSSCFLALNVITFQVQVLNLCHRWAMPFNHQFVVLPARAFPCLGGYRVT